MALGINREALTLRKLKLGAHMLDESALQRPTFLDGAAVRLADGGEWILPLPPRVRFCASSQEEYEAQFESLFGEGYLATLKCVVDSSEDVEMLQAELVFAIFLLARNYKLDATAFRQLLEFPPEDPALASLRKLSMR